MPTIYSNASAPSENNEEVNEPRIYPILKQREFTSQSNRINEFNTDKKNIEDLLIHYKKIKKRWTDADSGIKISGMIIAGALGAATAVCGGFTILLVGSGLIITSAVCGGVGALNLFLIEGISIGLTSRKKKVYREICEQIEHGIDKLYLFHQKASKDGILTDDELEESKKIIVEVKKEIARIKKSAPPDYEKSIKKDMVAKLKEEYTQKVKEIKKG